ncbi:MAG: ABC transporter permease [Campylobacterales bacterium]
MSRAKIDWSYPRFNVLAFSVWARNFKVWQRLMGPMLMLHIGEPLVYLIGIGLGLGMFVGDMDGISYLTFLASGFIASSIMMAVSMEGMYSVYTRMVTQQTYSSIMNTPVKIDDIILGEIIWCGTKGVLTSMAILAVSSVFGAIESFMALFAIPIGFLVGITFGGLAMVISAVSSGYEFFNYYFTLVLTTMLMLSGVFFPVSTLPEWLQGFVALLPLYHAVELIRPFVIGEIPEHLFLHIFVLLGYAFCGHFFATTLIRKRLVV